MKKEDLSKIFIALYAVLLALYVIVIVFAFEKEHFTEAFLMDSVVFISLHLVIPFIYPEKYKEGKVLANVGQLLKNPFFIGSDFSTYSNRSCSAFCFRGFEAVHS